jgi:HAD superfamily hydrolase (TIGR01549 family)
MIEFVMFDADGVLFDSGESNVAYYNAIFAQMDEPPLDAREEVNAISHAAEQVFGDRARGDEVMLARMKEIARTLDQTPYFRLLRPPFELRPFMLMLKSRYKLGLATNRSATVPALVEYLGIADVFDAIACMRDRVRPKPAPDILRLCMERADATPERAVYVGDSPVDRAAAMEAGTHFIGVGRRVEHHSRVHTIAELPALLDDMIASLRRPA